MPFFLHPYFYYIIIGLQAVCVFHSIRKGNQSRWIWLIVFLPLIGSIAYIFSEILTKRDLHGVQSSVGAIINRGGRVKDLEEKLRFSDTFNNRVALADAYLSGGQPDKAIELYESVLTGAFSDNEFVISRLVMAYYEKERYADLVAIAGKAKKSAEFKRSRAPLLYALALEKIGKTELAEQEFKALNGRFSAYECRYEFGMFLKRQGRDKDACAIFEEMLEEASHLSAREKRDNRTWLNKAREELESLHVS